MLLEHGVFGDMSGGMRLPLQEAFRHFEAWLKAMKISCSHKKFNAGSLVADGYGWFLTSKGYNARVLSEWIKDAVASHPTDDPRHHTTLVCLRPGSCGWGVQVKQMTTGIWDVLFSACSQTLKWVRVTVVDLGLPSAATSI